MNDKFNYGRASSADLRGKTAVVTGSSSGIGEAIVRRLAAAGAAVVVHARTNRPAAEQICAAIEPQGSPAICLLADLSDPAAADSLVEQAWQWRDGVDIWVNNAGADVLTGAAAEWSFDEKLDYLWRVDVAATMRLSRAVGRRMQQGGRDPGASVVLNIGWDQAEVGMAGDSGELFAATKGAVMAFTKSLAKSLAPAVRVNCLAPGWIRTAWGRSASQYWQERARRESLLNRWGTPDDVAQAALFLVSPCSAFITGQVLPVNGGLRCGTDAGQ